MFQLTFFLFLLTLWIYISGIESKVFTITNKCNYTVWPGISPPLDNTTGFVLKTGESKNLTAPPSWRGKVWGRTGCRGNGNKGVFFCATGNCDSGKIECSGYPPSPVTTLTEFSLDTGIGLDFFDVSLVDGYNLPIRIFPNGKNCTSMGCDADINKNCPPELRLISGYGTQVVGCKNACAAFQRPEYCCTGDYSSESCKTSSYAQLFKGSCPQAYSDSYDDRKSTMPCASSDFEITFCPSRNSTRDTPSRNTSQGKGNSLPPPLSTTGSKGSQSATLRIINECNYTIWPGISSPLSNTTGFILKSNESKNLTAPQFWRGSIWARSHCTNRNNNGNFSCATGDCRSLECKGDPPLPTPPVTLAEFNLNNCSGIDCFDVSLINGYNLPMRVVPQSRTGKSCSSTECSVDINRLCPPDLRLMSDNRSEVIGCKSTCVAFGLPQYCCKGDFGYGDCKPSSYSQVFKYACPNAYSYALDSSDSTFTCASADYTIIFCPSSNNSRKSWPDQTQVHASSPRSPPSTNSTNGKEDASEQSEAWPMAYVHELRLNVIACLVSSMALVFRLL